MGWKVCIFKRSKLRGVQFKWQNKMNYITFHPLKYNLSCDRWRVKKIGKCAAPTIPPTKPLTLRLTLRALNTIPDFSSIEQTFFRPFFNFKSIFQTVPNFCNIYETVRLWATLELVVYARQGRMVMPDWWGLWMGLRDEGQWRNAYGVSNSQWMRQTVFYCLKVGGLRTIHSLSKFKDVTFILSFTLSTMRTLQSYFGLIPTQKAQLKQIYLSTLVLYTKNNLFCSSKINVLDLPIL